MCVHRGDILGALSRAVVDSERRLRGLALEGVREIVTKSRTRHLNARHGPQESGRTRCGPARDSLEARAPLAGGVGEWERDAAACVHVRERAHGRFGVRSARVRGSWRGHVNRTPDSRATANQRTPDFGPKFGPVA